jgi:hypothetical protein
MGKEKKIRLESNLILSAYFGTSQHLYDKL